MCPAGVGSSPHTRGALRFRAAPPAWKRIIPAYAGSTKPIAAVEHSRTDHPRIRGEHVGQRGRPRPAVGSSPHTRGALIFSRAHIHIAQDHPRIRGEHVVVVESDGRGQGSSPHTRGAPPRGRPAPGSTGIIPAYAGSTNFLGAPDSVASDHPRIRGEHFHVLGVNIDAAGSSPHTRGARLRRRRDRGRVGIIPAYAGSTRVGRPRARRSRDHPRIRGEHDDGASIVRVIRGSSPHTRGAQIHR